MKVKNELFNYRSLQFQMLNLKLLDYTPKSFVVIGEDTRAQKENLKKLGGKWNSRLTDKNTGDKFGGWIFFSDLRPSVEKWLKNPKKLPETSSSFKDSNPRMEQLEKRVKELETELENIKRLVMSGNSVDSSEYANVLSESDEEDRIPRKRLLK